MAFSSPPLPHVPAAGLAAPAPARRRWGRWVTLLFAIPLLAFAVPMAVRMARPAPRSDVGTTKATAGGRYRVLLAPERTPVSLQQLHRWTIRVRLPDGRDALVDQIRVDGGMPQHGHGLPTQPRVTGRLPDGRFVVDGMKFSMPGWWELKLHVSGRAGTDSVTYNLSL